MLQFVYETHTHIHMYQKLMIEMHACHLHSMLEYLHTQLPTVFRLWYMHTSYTACKCTSIHSKSFRFNRYVPTTQHVGVQAYYQRLEVVIHAYQLHSMWVYVQTQPAKAWCCNKCIQAAQLVGVCAQIPRTKRVCSTCMPATLCFFIWIFFVTCTVASV